MPAGLLSVQSPTCSNDGKLLLGGQCSAWARPCNQRSCCDQNVTPNACAAPNANVAQAAGPRGIWASRNNAAPRLAARCYAAAAALELQGALGASANMPPCASDGTARRQVGSYDSSARWVRARWGQDDAAAVCVGSECRLVCHAVQSMCASLAAGRKVLVEANPWHTRLLHPKHDSQLPNVCEKPACCLASNDLASLPTCLRCSLRMYVSMPTASL